MKNTGICFKLDNKKSGMNRITDMPTKCTMHIHQGRVIKNIRII